MTEDTVIELAKQAGFLPDVGIPVHPSNLFKFAALVEQHLTYDSIHSCHPNCDKPACVAVRAAVAAEREECAKVADSMASGNEIGQFVLKDCAAAIRSRT